MNNIILITNDRAAKLNFKIKQGVGFTRRFRFMKPDGTYLDLTGLSPVMIVASAGTIITSYVIGDGLSIDSGDNTMLIMEKTEVTKNIPAGVFQHEMNIPTVGFMWQGSYSSIKKLN